MGVTKGCRKALLNKRKSLNNKQKFISPHELLTQPIFPFKNFTFQFSEKFEENMPIFHTPFKNSQFSTLFQFICNSKTLWVRIFFLPCQVVNLHDVAGVDWFVYRWLRLMFLIRESQQICNILWSPWKKEPLYWVCAVCRRITWIEATRSRCFCQVKAL